MLKSLLLALAATWSVAPAVHDPESRLAQLNRLIAARPADPALYGERGRLHECTGHLPLALLDFERAAELQPAGAAPAVGCARVLFALGRDQEALQCLDRAALLGEDSVTTDWLRGRVLAALGRSDEAAAVLAATLPRWRPARPEHYLELSEVTAAAGSAAAAVRVLDRGIDELGPVPGLVLAAVERDVDAGHFDTALYRLDALMAHATRRAPWHLARAGVLERAGRSAEAASARERAATERTLLHAADAARPLQLGPAPSVAAALSRQRDIIGAGSDWRFVDDGRTPAEGWRYTGFDDASWRSGRGQIGYGDGDETTIAEFGIDPGQRHVTTWFRREFRIEPGEPAFRWAMLQLLRADGAVVWLDGTEIVRSNMPSGPIDAATLALEEITGDADGDAGAAEPGLGSFYVDPSLLTPGDHVLAVEVHLASARSSDLSFDCRLLAGRATGPVIRGPYLQNGTPDGAVVRWRTVTPCETRVWIGPAPGALQLAYSDNTPVTNHTAVLTGLPPETKFHYAVGDLAGVLAGGDQNHHFTTLPPVGAVRPLRVWALGDSGTRDQNARSVRDAYLNFAAADPADVVLMLGDNAYPDGTDVEYQLAVFDMYPSVLRNTFLWSTLGNHDAHSAASATESGTYYNVFTLPRAGEAGGLPSGTEAYYSFDRGHVHFVCLDSQDSDRSATGPMLTWLQADLQSTQAPWVIAYFHHPPYTKGSHDSDNTGDSGGRMFDMRQQALPILEAHGVDLVLAGHSHSYERSYLIDGHYGFSWTFAPSMRLDQGDGRPLGDGSYGKETSGRGSRDGAVYITAGASGSISGGTLNHPAMRVSTAQLGSVLIDIDGHRLDGTYLRSDGAVVDTFTIEKNLKRALTRDVPAVSVGAGGTQTFHLDAGAQFAGQGYLLGGALDTAPGFQLGAVHVPLNLDPWFSTWAGLINSPVYPGTLGNLDGNGRGTAAFVLPAGALPGGLGLSLYHAYAVFDGSGPLLVSNTVRLRLVQ